MIRLALAACLLVPVLAAADTYPRQPGVDVLHYVFRLGLSDASSEITGESSITIKFLRDGVSDLEVLVRNSQVNRTAFRQGRCRSPQTCPCQSNGRIEGGQSWRARPP